MGYQMWTHACLILATTPIFYVVFKYFVLKSFRTPQELFAGFVSAMVIALILALLSLVPRKSGQKLSRELEGSSIDYRFLLESSGRKS